MAVSKQELCYLPDSVSDDATWNPDFCSAFRSPDAAPDITSPTEQPEF